VLCWVARAFVLFYLRVQTSAKLLTCPACLCGVPVQVMQGRPTGVVAASKDAALAREIQELFASPCMRVNTSTDVTGAQQRGSTGLGSSCRRMRFDLMLELNGPAQVWPCTLRHDLLHDLLQPAVHGYC
jgi:hypothetical protein